MKKLAEKIQNALIRAKLALNRVAEEERGDTNFISIAIVLVIVLVVAMVFIGFKDKLMPLFTKATDDLLDALS